MAVEDRIGREQYLVELRQVLSARGDERDLFSAVCRTVKAFLGCDDVRLYPVNSLENDDFGDEGDFDPHHFNGAPLVRLVSGSTRLLQQELSLPLFFSDVARVGLNASTRQALSRLGIRSLGLFPLFIEGEIESVLECVFKTRYHRWTRDDVRDVERCLELTQQHLQITRHQFSPQVAKLDTTEENQNYGRLIDYGRLIFLRTNRALRIVEVTGDTEGMLGLCHEELMEAAAVWNRFVHPADLRRLRLHMGATAPSASFDEEIRVIHQKNGAVHWLLVKGASRFSPQGELLGWEGFGVDVSDKHRTQEVLELQRRRLQALYEVARSLQTNSDPANVLLKGLRALVTATRSDAGFGCLIDKSSGRLELAAAVGLSEDYIHGIAEVLNEKSLVKLAVQEKRGILINDVQRDSRAAVDIARREGLHATIIVPLLFEQEAHGAAAIFCRRPARYLEDDFHLATACAQQMALAARQAEVYAAERQQAQSLAAVYRLTHELSKQLTPKEVAEHALPVIKDEFACKRMWIGSINDSGTHIAGLAGFGAGIRKPVIGIQIELNLVHDFLDHALETKEAIIVEKGQPMECSGLNRIMQRLSLGTFVIVPLLALGQVVGVLVVEPLLPSRFFSERKLPLLKSMAGEIANVILARRLELKIAESEKMRMAGVLTSGFAHNFNNLLQAVMGQASLIEVQAGSEAKVAQSARMIMDAAQKGATLIRQLLNFSLQNAHSAKEIELGKYLSELRDFFGSVLGSDVKFELQAPADVNFVMADSSRLQQALTNLLMNAKEAVIRKRAEFSPGSYTARVVMSITKVRLRSGEVDPELAPGEYLRIDIQDNGAGMDPEEQARCFEPFFTTKNVDSRTGLGFSGSGLGLSSAYSILKQHEGLITVRSESGVGTVFTMYLPALIAREKEIKIENPGRTFDVEIVLFDLDEGYRFSLRSALESLGFRVAVVSSRETLIQHVAKGVIKHTILLCDVTRESEGLMELVKRLRSGGARVSVILSGVDMRRWRKVTTRLPGVEAVERPLGAWAVHSVIRKLLGTPTSLEANVEREVTNGATKVGESQLDAAKQRKLDESFRLSKAQENNGRKTKI